MKIGFNPFSQNTCCPLISTLFSGLKTVAKVALIALTAIPMARAEPLQLSPYIKRFPLLGKQFFDGGALVCPFYEPASGCLRTTDKTHFRQHEKAVDALQDLSVPNTKSSLINRLWVVARSLSDAPVQSYRTGEMAIPIALSDTLSSEQRVVYNQLVNMQRTVLSSEEVSDLRTLCTQLGMTQTVHPSAIQSEVDRLATEYEEAVARRDDPIQLAAKVHTRLYRIAPFQPPIRTDTIAQLFTNVVLSGIGNYDSVVYPDAAEYRTVTHQSVEENNSTRFASYLKTKIIPWVQLHRSFLLGRR